MKTIQRQWFLIALAAVFLAGLLMPHALRGIADASWYRPAIVFSVLFLMSLPLETRSVWRSITRPWPALLACVINMGFLPIAGWFGAKLLTGDFAIGLVIAAVAPCTAASAAVWTRRAGGNDATAILVTLLTNLSCFVLTPLWLVLLLNKSVSIELRPMVMNLGIFVVLPMLVGQIVRQYKPVGNWATANRRMLSTFAQIGILNMVLIGAIRCGLRLGQSTMHDQFSVGSFFAMTAIAILLHLTALWFGWTVADWLGIDRENRIAVAIAGSQKTLMVGLHVSINYFGGLTLLPMVVYHIAQLVLDTVIADYWKTHDEPTANRED